MVGMLPVHLCLVGPRRVAGDRKCKLTRRNIKAISRRSQETFAPQRHYPHDRCFVGPWGWEACPVPGSAAASQMVYIVSRMLKPESFSYIKGTCRLHMALWVSFHQLHHTVGANRPLANHFILHLLLFVQRNTQQNKL